MQKFLKLSTVSMLAIVVATNANAAGYTCEELIEYTSCNPGYYLSGHDECNKSEDYPYYLAGLCEIEAGTYKYGYTEAACTAEGGTYYPGACFGGFDEMVGEAYGWDSDEFFFASQNCIQCQAGTSCAGGIAYWQYCPGGTYQPNAGQSSCLLTPAGTYTEDVDIKWTEPIKCAPGSYQPQSGQTSCVECPAGSYCAGTGLSAVSGECAIGTYAVAGADACTSCPSAGLIDINGAVVNATTLSAGAESISACVIGPDARFKDDAGIYHFKSNCEYKLSTFEEACTEYQKTDASVDCDVEFDIDEFYYCDDENGRLIYDPETGGIGCHVEDSYSSGCDLEGLDSIKSHCELTNGTYDPLTTKCICPSGTEWTCAIHYVNGEEWDGLGCESVE
ncbi:MAG: hypothetical protein IKB10_02220 [Alphaproteobacteria bacterium]|nr:hypothetical protein [Alphaproteobacteria bacterium]